MTGVLAHPESDTPGGPMTEETYIRDLTVGEFTSLLRTVFGEVSGHKRPVKGYAGLADLLGCSVSTVKRY